MIRATKTGTMVEIIQGLQQIVKDLTEMSRYLSPERLITITVETTVHDVREMVKTAEKAGKQ